MYTRFFVPCSPFTVFGPFVESTTAIEAKSEISAIVAENHKGQRRRIAHPLTTTWQFDPEKRVEMPKKAAAAKPSARNVAVAKAVGETLEALFPGRYDIFAAYKRLCRSQPNPITDPPIPLNHTDSFTLLTAVILSAQTTDAKVNEVTTQLFQHAPTPAKLAAMKYERLLELIRTVGLAPTKAKNLLKCSQRLVDDFDGQVPSTFEELESLAGVGHKTASCVMSQAFGQQSFAVDTHIERLAKRWRLVKESAKVEDVEESFKSLFPPERWGKLHLQLIYFVSRWKRTHRSYAYICLICC